MYGTVRTVVWEDGEGDFPSYPIIYFEIKGWILVRFIPTLQQSSEMILQLVLGKRSHESIYQSPTFEQEQSRNTQDLVV